MDSSNALSIAPDGHEPPAAALAGPAAVLKGTARGLEMLVDGRAAVDAIVAALTRRLDEAPGFFKGSNVRVAVEHGPLAPGCLARLDALAGEFELRIIEVGAAKRASADRDAVPRPSLAAGSAPTAGFEDEGPTQTAIVTAPATAASPEPAVTAAPELPVEPVTLAEAELSDGLSEIIELVSAPGVPVAPISFEEVTQTATPRTLAATPEAELATTTEGTRLVVGPVRSGVILEHHGHVVVFGDVNPGAEVRAAGNIIVLGRLRGTAHAGIGQEVGFILALRLEPQQLRIGRMVARSADSDVPASDAEIAYATGEQIVVERYLGKLPRNLATSL